MRAFARAISRARVGRLDFTISGSNNARIARPRRCRHVYTTRMKQLATFSLACFTLVSVATEGRAQMRPPIPMTAAAYASAHRGQSIHLLIRVESRRRSQLQGEILDRRTDSLYTQTGKRTELFFSDDTPVVMGSQSDVVVGALVFVDGILTSRNRADVKKAVVVTRDVTVEPARH